MGKRQGPIKPEEKLTKNMESLITKDDNNGEGKAFLAGPL